MKKLIAYFKNQNYVFTKPNSFQKLCLEYSAWIVYRQCVYFTSYTRNHWQGHNIGLKMSLYLNSLYKNVREIYGAYERYEQREDK